MELGGSGAQHPMLGHIPHLAMETGIQPRLQTGFFALKVDPGYTYLVKA